MSTATPARAPSPRHHAIVGDDRQQRRGMGGRGGAADALEAGLDVVRRAGLLPLPPVLPRRLGPLPSSGRSGRVPGGPDRPIGGRPDGAPVCVLHAGVAAAAAAERRSEAAAHVRADECLEERDEGGRELGQRHGTRAQPGDQRVAEDDVAQRPDEGRHEVAEAVTVHLAVQHLAPGRQRLRLQEQLRRSTRSSASKLSPMRPRRPRRHVAQSSIRHVVHVVPSSTSSQPSTTPSQPSRQVARRQSLPRLEVDDGRPPRPPASRRRPQPASAGRSVPAVSIAVPCARRRPGPSAGPPAGPSPSSSSSGLRRAPRALSRSIATETV